MTTARWAGLVCGAVLSAAACAGPAPLPPGAVPVLFVHGYGADAGMFDDMVEHLRGRGYPASYLEAVQLDPPVGSNVDAATRQIAPAVEELVAATGGGPAAKVDVVAHSMGALSSRWYTAKLRPERVRTLVTVAGANHGTDVLCGEETPGGFDLCPAFADDEAHEVQIGLNGRAGRPVDETPYSSAADAPGVRAVPADAARAVRYVAVLVPDDGWIHPPSSSGLSGASPVATLPPGVAVTQQSPGNLLFAQAKGHDEILQDEGLFALLDSVFAGDGG